VKSTILLVEEYVKKQLYNDFSGHDWYHADRVRKLSLEIASKEGIEMEEVIEISALLHDTIDEKLFSAPLIAKKQLEVFLESLPLSLISIKRILRIIETISYKGGNQVEITDPYAMIVRDADRLDAIGAIGIARTFAYGGKKGQPLFDPNVLVRDKMGIEQYREGKSSSIHHFHEKLLKLISMIHTDSARAMAEERHLFMQQFLDQFMKEWKGTY
jgi:uncharacterized protein